MSFVGLVSAIAAVAGSSFNASTERGVFVFGGLVLDFQRGRERWGRDNALVDCSDDTRFCVDGDVFNVVLPKQCEDIRPDSVWRQGDLETRVIGREGGWSAHASGPWNRPPFDQTYYLRTNVRPEVVFAYTLRRGIVAVYYVVRAQLDPASAIDFAQLARDDQLGQFTRAAIGNPDREPMILHLITFDQFGSCHESTIQPAQ